MAVLRLAAQPRGLRIVPLTRERASILKAQAAVALNGDERDGKCSLRAMTMSCFASENCSNGYSSMQLDMLLSQPHAYVAVTDVAPDGSTPLAEDVFVGCVTASSVSTMVTRLFPHVTLGADDLVLSNLCVAERYRTHGIGRRLVQTILDIRSPHTYLLIARTSSANPDVQTVFHSRVQRLRDTYKRLGFEEECECTDAVLMRHK